MHHSSQHNPVRRLRSLLLYDLSCIVITGTLLLTAAWADPNYRQLIKDGNKLFKEDNYDTALRRYEAAFATARNAAEKKKLGQILIRQTGELYKKGLYVQVAQYLENTIAIQADSKDAAGEIMNLNNLARIRIILGDYSGALTDLERAQVSSKAAADGKLAALTLISFGYVHYNLRNYQQSIDYLDQASEIAGKLKDRNLMADAHFLKGTNYRQQGDFEKGIQHLKKALELYTGLRRQPVIGSASRNLGECYLHRMAGDRQQTLKQAKQLLERAREIHKKYSNDLEYAMAVSHLGELGFKLKEYTSAIRQYRLARKTFEQLAFPDGVGRMHIHLGFTFIEQEDFDAAFENFDAALEIYRQLDDREWTRVALYGKGVTFQKMGYVVRAEESYKEAVAVFESIRGDVAGGEEARDLFSEANSKIYENLVELLVSRGDINGALEYIERSRLRSLREQLINPGPSTVRGERKNLASEHHVLLKKKEFLNDRLHTAKDPETRARLETKLIETDKHLATVAYELKLKYREYADISHALKSMRDDRDEADYPVDVAIIIYFVTHERLYIFLINRASESAYKIIEVPRQQLRSRVWDTKSLIKNTATRATASAMHIELRQLLRELYRLLVEPVESALGDTANVAILPHDWLGYLPFEALIKQGAGVKDKFFIQTKNITYLTSQTSITRVNKILRTRKNASIKSIVAFGNPDLGFEEAEFVCRQVNTGDQPAAENETADRYGKFPPLPCAETEVENIKRYFPESVIYTRKDATKENFIEHWTKHQIIHIAAHARLTEIGSELLLAPEEDGKLTTLEIVDLNQAHKNKNTRFIALSACQTGVDPMLGDAVEIDPGTTIETATELAGTVHAFLFVDIPAVLATLWSISDVGTPLLMNDFYRNLKHFRSKNKSPNVSWAW